MASGEEGNDNRTSEPPADVHGVITTEPGELLVICPSGQDAEAALAGARNFLQFAAEHEDLGPGGRAFAAEGLRRLEQAGQASSDVEETVRVAPLADVLVRPRPPRSTESWSAPRAKARPRAPRRKVAASRATRRGPPSRSSEDDDPHEHDVAEFPASLPRRPA